MKDNGDTDRGGNLEIFFPLLSVWEQFSPVGVLPFSKGTWMHRKTVGSHKSCLPVQNLPCVSIPRGLYVSTTR